MNDPNDNTTPMKPQPATRWFDRKFDRSLGAEQFDQQLNRLAQFPAALRQVLDNCSKAITTVKPDGKWSVNENVGHLFLLEPLWCKRFQEIKDDCKHMSPADLNNTATEQASFNELLTEDLLERFRAEREKTVLLLQGMSREDLLKQSIHPRLGQPMTVTDMMYFVAEHDEHHLRAIQQIIGR